MEMGCENDTQKKGVFSVWQKNVMVDGETGKLESHKVC